MENTGKQDNLFRKKSIDQLSTPDQLTSYLRVTGPGVWVVLIGLLILMGGLLIWGIFGNIVSTVTVPALVANGKAACYVLQEEMTLPEYDIEISIGDVKIKADPADAKAVTLNASDAPVLFESGYLSPGRNVYILLGDTSLADGSYDAVVVKERLRPISLLYVSN